MKPRIFLLTLGLTTILSVSGGTIFSPTQKPSFINKAIAQTTVRISNNFVRLDMPQTGIQDDSWSCGPNSLSKLLRFYGHQVNYQQVRSISQRDKGIIPPRICVLGVCRNLSGLKTGFEPWELRDVMRRWEGNSARYERDFDLNRLKGLLRQGKPVLALLRTGSFRPAGGVIGTWPELHWVVVMGFNEQEGRIYTADTDGNSYQYYENEFMSKWDWSIGSGLAKETIYGKGVRPRTIVYSDRVPPVVPQQIAALEELNKPSLIPLTLYWNDTRKDNATVATLGARRAQEGSGYAGPSIQGCIFSRQQPGTIPLLLFWHQQRQDNATVATPAMIQAQKDSGYDNPAVQGYIFPTQQPGTIPLLLFWHQQRQDNATVATPAMIQAQRDSGYGNPAVQGYIFPSDRCR